MVLFVVGGLFATDYNVIVYPANEEVSAYIKSFFKTKPFDKGILEMKVQREKAAALKTLGEALDTAWDSEDEASIKEAKSSYNQALQSYESELEEGVFDVVLLDSSGLSFNADEIAKGDSLLLEQACDLSGADLVVVPVVSTIQGFNHMALYCYSYGDEEMNLVYESVSKDSNRFGMRAVLKLAGLFMEDVPAVLRLDNLVTGASVSVAGSAVSVMDNCILVPEGEHTICIEAQGYRSRLISTYVAGNEISSLDASMTQLQFSGLEVKSEPDSQVIVDGTVVGQTPLTLDLYSVPLTLRLVSEGYADRTVSLIEQQDLLDVDMKPLWLSEKGLLKDRKDDFYAAFARSLLIFGAKIALGTFNDGTNKVLTALDIVSNAAITVSVVDLVGCLIDYYRQSEYIAR